MGVQEADEFRQRVAALPEPYQSNFSVWLRDYVGPLKCASDEQLDEARQLLLKTEKYFGRRDGEYWRKMKDRSVLSLLGAALWLALGARQLASSAQPMPLGLLPLLQSLTVAALLITRRKEKWPTPFDKLRAGSATQTIFAWVSALLPLLMTPGGATLPPSTRFASGLAVVALQLAGLSIALWGLLTLGRSFGIAPADRGLVKAGPYRLVRHPIYLGELIGLVGILLSAPTWTNSGLFMLIAASLVARSWLEEEAIAGYDAYAGRVRWRLVPLIW